MQIFFTLHTYALFTSFFKKWAIPGLCLIYFRSFQTNITIFTMLCEKCPTSITCRDSNPRPLERESLPVTTRPGLPPISSHLYLYFMCLSLFMRVHVHLSASNAPNRFIFKKLAIPGRVLFIFVFSIQLIANK